MTSQGRVLRDKYYTYKHFKTIKFLSCMIPSITHGTVYFWLREINWVMASRPEAWTGQATKEYLLNTAMLSVSLFWKQQWLDVFIVEDKFIAQFFLASVIVKIQQF